MAKSGGPPMLLWVMLLSWLLLAVRKRALKVPERLLPGRGEVVGVDEDRARTRSAAAAAATAATTSSARLGAKTSTLDVFPFTCRDGGGWGSDRILRDVLAAIAARQLEGGASENKARIDRARA